MSLQITLKIMVTGIQRHKYPIKPAVPGPLYSTSTLIAPCYYYSVSHHYNIHSQARANLIVGKLRHPNHHHINVVVDMGLKYHHSPQKTDQKIGNVLISMTLAALHKFSVITTPTPTPSSSMPTTKYNPKKIHLWHKSRQHPTLKI